MAVVGGHVAPRPVVSLRRAVLTVRVLTLCAAQLRDSNIIALGSSMRVRVPSQRELLSPAVVIVRRWPEFWGQSHDVVTNPHAIFEVASVATDERERRRKLAALAQLPSLEHYVLIMDDSVSVEHHLRGDGHGWHVTRHHRRDNLCIESLDVELAVDAIYSWR